MTKLDVHCWGAAHDGLPIAAGCTDSESLLPRRAESTSDSLRAVASSRAARYQLLVAVLLVVVDLVNNSNLKFFNLIST